MAAFLASLILLMMIINVASFSLLENTLEDGDVSSRRCWIRSVAMVAAAAAAASGGGSCAMAIPNFGPSPAHAESTGTTTMSNPLDRLIDAQETLGTLLANYQRATVDCTFADVPRELLESKNKELLLEKARTFALFDKSVSVETCKTTNRIVRDYLGVTGKGPLVGIEKQIKYGLDYVDANVLEDYVGEWESFSRAYSKASTLSYAAGVANLDSVNNFSKEEAQEARKENSNLEQTKQAIGEAKNSLDKLVAILQRIE